MKSRYFYYLAAFIVSVLCLFPLSALGNPIDVEQALKAVENYRKKPARNGARRAPALAKGKLQHAYTKKTAAGAPAVYVFNTGDGFILASADDATVPVLGYSDNGDFDPNNIPDGLRYMLGEYANQMAALPPRKANAVTPTYSVEYTAPIEPLIQTHWEQRNPYNIEFPLTGVGAAATGCVTTAMAQIMRYHKWPARGFGSAEQDAQPVVAITHYERNYYERNYQWDLMYNTTSEIKASQASINAVSQLMMDLAVGLFTEYTGGGTSNSNSSVITPMLLSYFNYDPSVENISLSSLGSQDEFNHIVITDLLAGRPVYFQGGPNNAAHAYVCDGYDGEGLFHINWGWGGTDDGYYLITNLTPAAGGVGGAGGVGYSQNLVMVHNIMPNQGGVLPRPILKAHYSTDIDPGYKLVKDGSSYYFYGNFNVYGTPDDKPRNFRGKLGLRIVDANGQETIVWENKYTQIKARNHYDGFRIDMQSSWAAEGTRVYYIYKEYDADSYRTIHDTRGDACCITFKRNGEGELEATCNDVAVCTIEQGSVAPTNTVNVTYNIYLNNQSIGTKVVAEAVGQAPSMSFIPDYYVSATGFPSVITESATYRIDTQYKDGKLPFQFDKAYNILYQMNGSNYLWQQSVNVVNVKANPTSSDYANTNAQWRFGGNWLDGFTIQNAGSGSYLTAPMEGGAGERMLIASGLSYGDRQKCLLQHRNDGFYFKQKDCNLYLALTNVSSLNILLSDEKNFAGNLVTICEPSQLPAPTGVDYTVSISGHPETAMPRVLYQNVWYNNEGHINAVNLSVTDLYASPIDGYTPEITIGAKTIYVEYVANRPTSRNYTVNVNAPTGQSAALYYNGQSYASGSTLTAEGLSLMQLTATAINGYEPNITIGSSTITVNYTPYTTYTVNITGLSGTEQAAAYLLYAGQSLSHGQTFSAANLTAKELFATSFPNYSYEITISNDRKVTVAYSAYVYHFSTTSSAYSQRVHLNQSPVSISYYSNGWANEIYKESVQYTDVTTSRGSIERIVFDNLNIEEGEIKANSGQKTNTLEWTFPEGTQSVRFTGGTATSTGLTVYLKAPDTVAPQPVAYTVGISGAPAGQNPVLYYKSKAYTHGKTFFAVGLEDVQLSATAIGGYTYNISVDAGNTISVVYTSTGEPTPPTPVGTTYTVSIIGAPSGQSPVLYYNEQPVGTQFTASNLSLTQLSATNIPGYSYDIVIGTSTVTVTYTAVGTTYTVSIVGAPSGYSPVLNFGTSSYAHGQQFTATSLSLTQLSATTIPGYSYDIVIGTSTVTVTYTAVGTTYTVSIVGAPSGYSPVLNFGTSSYAHGQQFTATSLSQTQLSATTIPGYSYNIVIGTSTVTVTYTADAPAGTTYTVSIVGAPSDYSPVLNYGTSSYAHGQQFTATSLSQTQLSATTIPGYSYNIVIGTSTVTVTYTEQFPKVGVPYVLQESSGSLYLNVISNTEAGTLAGTKNVVLKSAPQALYFSSQGTGFYIQNGEGLYVGKSTANGWNMSADTPELWTVEPVGTGYALHCERGYLGFDDVTSGGTASAGFRDKAATARAIFNITEAQSTTYNVVVSGTDNANAGVVFGGVTYHHGESIETFDALTESSVAAAEVSGLIGTVTLSGTTFTVAYAAPSSESYHFETTTYSSGRQYFSDGPVSGSYYPYSGKNNIYGSSWYTEVESSGEPIASIAFDNIEGFTDNGGVQPSTGSIDLSTGIWTASDASTYYVKFTGGDGYSTGLTVYLMSSGPTTYTVVVNDLPSGGAVTLNGQDLTTGGTYTVSKTLSLSDLSVTEPDGYFAETAYDPATHTFTVTFHECYLYPVVVVGTSDAAAGVVYDGVTYHHGESIQAKTPLYATSVTPASVTGQEGSVTFENGTFTVTYRMVTCVTWDYPTDIPIYGNGTTPKDGVTVYAQYWGYDNANIFEDDLVNYDYGYLRLASESPITKVVFHVEPGKSGMNTLIANTGSFTSLASTTSTWEGSANEIIFGSTSDVYVRSLEIYIAGPTEEEQALQEIEEARVEIASGTLGYPVLTDELRNDPNMAAYVAYYDDPTGYTGTLADLQASYDYFLTHCDEVNRPAPGHAYKLSVRSSDGTKRWYLTDGGGLTTTASSAAVFVMGGTDNEDYNTLFATNDNTASHYLQNNGATATAYTASTCDFNLASMLRVQSTNVNTQPASRLGTFSLTSSARHDDATLPGTLVIDESNETWSKADTPFMNGSFTSAIEMEEVEYPYTRPNLVSGTEGSHEGVFATVWLPFPMIFPDGVEVYKGTQQHTAAGQSYLALERVDTDHAVARGGYILYSETLEAGAIDVLPAPSAPTDTHLDTDAVFIGSTDLNTDGSSLYWTLLAGKNPYVLANKSKGIGFYRYTGTTFPKGKAIWLAPEPETAETVKFGFEDVIEAIKSLHGYGSDTLIYDLNGHRLNKVQKGQVNVVNGKKIMIK